jgi:hypothetical protein
MWRRRCGDNPWQCHLASARRSQLAVIYRISKSEFKPQCKYFIYISNDANQRRIFLTDIRQHKTEV